MIRSHIKATKCDPMFPSKLPMLDMPPTSSMQRTCEWLAIYTAKALPYAISLLVIAVLAYWRLA